MIDMHPVTPSPISIPRRPSLTSTFHITLPNATLTSSVFRLLTTQPLFPISSSRPLTNAYSRIPSLNNTLNLREQLRVQLIDASAKDWVGTQIRAVDVQAERDTQRLGLRPTEPLDRRWVGEKGVSGKRVVVKGLPIGMPTNAVKEMAKGIALADTPDNIMPLPP